MTDVLTTGATPRAAEASAAATARSHAGSSTRMPPEEAPNNSARPSGIPPDVNCEMWRSRVGAFSRGSSAPVAASQTWAFTGIP